MSEDLVDKIAKKLPIRQAYDDAISPSAKQVGAIGEDLLKTLRLALFPLQFGAALQDRFERFVKESVSRVPHDYRVAPPPQIIGPVLEGIRFEPENTQIDELFSTLLSNAMDIRNIGKTHPAFPIILRQMSSDEAIIIKELKKLSFYSVETYEVNPLARQDDSVPYWINKAVERELDFPFDILCQPRQFHFYTSHLFYLGLAGFSESRQQEAILGSSGNQIGTRKFVVFHLLPLGASFADACIPDAKS